MNDYPCMHLEVIIVEFYSLFASAFIDICNDTVCVKVIESRKMDNTVYHVHNQWKVKRCCSFCLMNFGLVWIDSLRLPQLKFASGYDTGTFKRFTAACDICRIPYANSVNLRNRAMSLISQWTYIQQINRQRIAGWSGAALSAKGILLGR